jgi:GT2 family glycosyltransferase
LNSGFPDDYLEPEAVELLLQEAQNTRAKVVYSSYRLVGGNRKVVGLHPERDRDHLGFAADLVRQHIDNDSSTLIDRSVLEKVGLFDEDLKAGEEYDFWLRACLLHKCRFRCVEAYRVHKKQLTARIGQRRVLENTIHIRQTILQQVEATDSAFCNFLEYQLHLHTFGEAFKHARRFFFLLLRKPLRLSCWTTGLELDLIVLPDMKHSESFRIDTIM